MNRLELWLALAIGVVFAGVLLLLIAISPDDDVVVSEVRCTWELPTLPAKAVWVCKTTR